jgi:hypothetical protein
MACLVAFIHQARKDTFMPTYETIDSPMLAIVAEKRLSGPSWCLVDEQGAITIIDDISKIAGPPLDVEQMFVSLSPRGALSLRNLLNEPAVLQLLKSNA